MTMPVFLLMGMPVGRFMIRATLLVVVVAAEAAAAARAMELIAV